MGISNNKTYWIKSNAGAGRTLGVVGNTIVNNSAVKSQIYNPSLLTQKWTIKSISGYLRLINEQNTSFGLHNTNDTADVYSISSGGTSTALTYVTINSATNVYKIKMRFDDLYLTADSSNNVTWTSNTNSVNQQWKFIDTSKNYAIYPCKKMNITQKYDGSYSHSGNYTGTPKDYPTDENCGSTSRSYIYCPCDEMEIMRIYGVGNSGQTNTIWLKSTSPVTMPSGTDYLIMMVMHPNDDDLMSLSENQVFTRGEAMFREGNSGSTSYHFHISLGTGTAFASGTNGWVCNSNNKWVLTPSGETKKIEECFYIDPSFTTIIDDKSIPFVTL